MISTRLDRALPGHRKLFEAFATDLTSDGVSALVVAHQVGEHGGLSEYSILAFHQGEVDVLVDDFALYVGLHVSVLHLVEVRELVIQD